MDTIFLDDFSQEVWTTTYKHKNDNTIDDSLKRVAKAVASVETTDELKTEWEQKFYKLLSGFKITAGGRILANAGTGWSGTTLMNCFHGDTEVLTFQGIKKIKGLVGHTATVLNKDRDWVPVTFKSYGKQRLFRVDLSNGDIIFTTKNHRWFVKNKKSSRLEEVSTLKLLGRQIPYIIPHQHPIQSPVEFKMGVRHGLVMGDGNLYLDGRYTILHQFGDSCHLIRDYFDDFTVGKYCNPKIEKLSVNKLPHYYKTVIPTCQSYTVDYVKGFLAGLVAADGCVDKYGSVMLFQSDEEFLYEIKKVAAELGIVTTSIALYREKNPFNGKYAPCYKLSFLKSSFPDDMIIKKTHQSYRQKNQSKLNLSVKVNSVCDALCEDEVFCCEEAKTGTFVLGNFLLTGNCFVGPKPKYDQDSIEGIFSVLTSQVLTLKSEGGWGMNFSFIRPRGSFIQGIGVETPGAVKYMEIFNTTSDVITAGSGKKKAKSEQQGKIKIRKGAMMGVLDCVTGDTEISTLTGKVPIKNLIGETPLVYCTDGKGRVYIRKVDRVWSKGIRSVVKIKFDDDTFLKCTDEHLIMLANGSYKAAKDLDFGDSVSVLHKRLYKKYYQLGVTSFRVTIPEHIAVAEYQCGRYPLANEDVHHVDFITTNNHPNNLEILTKKEHFLRHKQATLALLAREREKLNVIRRGKTWEEFYGKEKGAQLRIKWSEARRRNKKPAWNKGLTGDAYKNHYPSEFSNHKVVSVERCDEEEVYDMSVPEFHNFVANGVFIHNCWHPDIEEFITAKSQNGRLNKFNLSVNCSNEFMDKVTKVCEIKKLMDLHAQGRYGGDQQLELLHQDLAFHDKWDLIFPDTKYHAHKTEWDGNINLWKSKSYPIKVYKTVRVSDLWNLIIQTTYSRNDPGVLFLDRANATHCYNYGGARTHIAATNPCGEQCLPFGFVCNLATINLTQFVMSDGKFDFVALSNYVPWAVRFLDNVNDLTGAPLPEYLDAIRSARRIGLGVMGWGSLLYMLKIRFASPEAEALKARIMETITSVAINASVELAAEKGAFVGCSSQLHADAPFFKSINVSPQILEKMRKHGIRNSALFSCQPNGNTGVLANIVSGGIEPVFSPEYTRTVIVDGCPQDMLEITPKYWENEFKETSVFKWTQEGDDKILRGKWKGIVYKVDKNRGLTKEVPCIDYGVRWLMQRGEWNPKAKWAVTAAGLTVQEHLSDLKGFAKWIDSSISKTVNLPNDYPYEDFSRLYLDAYLSGVLKGITTYRDGTMMNVLSANKQTIVHTTAPKRPDVLSGEIFSVHYKKDKLYVAVGLWEDGSPYECFTGVNFRSQIEKAKGKIVKQARGKYSFVADDGIEYHLTNGHSDSNADALTRCLSAALRHGTDISYLVHQLEKTEGDLTSFSKVIARVLKKFIKNGTLISGEECPNCQGHLVRSEGCYLCTSCGYSKCS